jgi:hypothetical protein
MEREREREREGAENIFFFFIALVTHALPDGTRESCHALVRPKSSLHNC